MILWISGNSGAGKTTLAKALIGTQQGVVHLDGDEVRKKYNNNDFSKEGRWKHCLDVAKEAYQLSQECYCVVVSVIAPYKKLREEIKEICNCTFLYLPGSYDGLGSDYPYEWPDHPIQAYRFYIDI